MRRRRCKDGCLKLVERCVATLERGLDRVELRLEEALRETSRVCHLEHAILEPRLVSGELRGEPSVLPESLPGMSIPLDVQEFDVAVGDDGYRGDSTTEGIGKLKPAFDKDFGVLTAASSRAVRSCAT